MYLVEVFSKESFLKEKEDHLKVLTALMESINYMIAYCDEGNEELFLALVRYKSHFTQLQQLNLKEEEEKQEKGEKEEEVVVVVEQEKDQYLAEYREEEKKTEQVEEEGGVAVLDEEGERKEEADVVEISQPKEGD